MPDNCFFGDHHHRDLQSEFLAVEQPRQQQQQHWSSSRPSSPLASALDFSLLLFEGFEGGSSSFRMLTSSPVPAPAPDAAAQVADVTTTTTISSPDVSPIKSRKSNGSAAEGEDSDGIGGSPARKQQQQQPKSPKVFFSAQNKISVFSLEYRVDYHLKRIMKSSRLINFKNSIEVLPIEERIYESLLEIILSSHSLISRRHSMITIGDGILEEITALLKAGNVEGAFAFLFGDSAGGGDCAAIASLKHISSSLGQLVWALNSNKEHVKYVAKVFALPETYHRREKNLGGGGGAGAVSRGCGVYAAAAAAAGKDEDFGVVVQLKERLAAMVALAEQTIARAETLRAAVHDALLATALAMAAIEEGFGLAEDEKRQELLGDQEEEEAPTEAIAPAPTATTTDEAYPFAAVAVAAEA